MMARPASCILVFSLAVLASSCSFAPFRTARGGGGGDEAGEAQLSRIVAAFDSTHYASAVHQSRELIRTVPAFQRMDEVYYRAARSSLSLARFGDAIKFSSLLLERYPVSAHDSEAMLICAEGYLGLRQFSEATEWATKVTLAPGESDAKKRAGEIQKAASAKLSPGELETLLKKYPSAPIADDLALDVAKNEYARGDYESAYELLADMLYRFPEHPRAPEIRRLLSVASEKRSSPAEPRGLVYPFRIGTVLPMTGKFSMYGKYFEAGLALAVDGYNETAPDSVTLVRADSRGDPVEAVKAARRLIHEEGVIAIVGSVLATPTLAAAVEANARGVPFLSAVNIEDELTDIGPWVFQTAVSGDIEVTAMARCAMDKLLLRRYAVLAPAVGGYKHLAEFFAQEISSLGGTIVSLQYFEPNATDFKDQLEAIGESLPEALFIPASPEELINILPQVRYYDVHARLLGLSEWNSEKLIRLSYDDIEGALFPLATYHGENAATYQQFLARHRETIGGEVNPLTVEGYFGTRAVLEAIQSGMSDREEVRDFLAGKLYGDAERRAGEAAALSILTVHNGEVVEFAPASPAGK
jgi:branched-chain amino acid transport system substrate-binding protein